MNGSVMPLAGIRCKIDRHVDRALDAEQHDQSGGGEAAERILVARGHEQGRARRRRRKSPAIRRQARIPNSSPVTAKMKSVWASGRMRLIVPFARALAEPAAGQEAVERGVDLKRVGDAAASAWIDEFDRCARVHAARIYRRAARRRSQPRQCPRPRTNAARP